ncbi:MAG: hypothetical protein Kow0090_09880 [Myxococcota bacterium]
MRVNIGILVLTFSLSFASAFLTACGKEETEGEIKYNDKTISLEVRIPDGLKDKWEEVNELRITILITAGAYPQRFPYSPKSGKFKATFDGLTIEENFKISLEAFGEGTLLFYGRKDNLKVGEKINLTLGSPDNFTLLATLDTPVWGHTQSVYDNDAKVLIFGGSTGGDYQDGPNSALPEPTDYSTENMPLPQLYNHETGEVCTAGNDDCELPPFPDEYKPRRIWHTATTLPTGEIVIVGGMDELGEPISQILIFDPKTGTVTSQKNDLLARFGHQTALHPIKGLFIIGGYKKDKGNLVVANDIITYDHEANQGVAIQHTIPEPLAFHSVTTLQDGKTLLIAGGKNENSPFGIKNLYVYGDSGIQSLDVGEKSNMSNQRWMHSALLLKEGNVALMGGYASVAEPKAGDFGDIYLANVGSLGVVHKLVPDKEVGMLYGRVGLCAVVLGNNDIFVYGGIQRKNNTYITAAEPYIMRPTSAAEGGEGITLSYEPAGGSLGTEPIAEAADRSFARISRLIDGMLVISGGFDGNGAAVAEIIGYMEKK